MRSRRAGAAILSAVIFSVWLSSLEAAPRLDYSTYLGGSLGDTGHAAAVDSNGCVYVAGYTQSPDFPTLDSYQSARSGDYDVFVSKFSASGNPLIYSTYLGGSGDDRAIGAAADDQECAIVVGSTSSADFPVSSWAWQTVFRGGGTDAFVVRLSSDGSALNFSSFLGGEGLEQAQAVAFDDSGWIYVAGYTASDDFPTHNPFQASRAGGYDVFVTQLSPEGHSLYYSTYLGGAGADRGNAVAVDADNSAYIAGQTFSADFPTRNPFQASARSLPASSAFVSKLTPSGIDLSYSTYLGGSGYDSSAQGIALDDYKQARVAGYTAAPDFPTLNPCQAANRGGTDAFATGFSSGGDTLLFSTYLGGTSDDICYGIAVDPYYGDSHICGYSKSSDFPLEAPFQAQLRGEGDAFYSNLNADGDRLHYSTYLGGSGNWDAALGVVFKDRPDERVWLTGETDSPDFPLRRAYQGSFGGGTGDAFLAGFAWSAAPNPACLHSDFNGDGTSDVALFREATGLWAVRGLTRVYHGSAGDTPAAGDYNGDGTSDIAVFRSAAGLWSVRGLTRAYFGIFPDQPLPRDYNGDGTNDIAVFRSASGLWAVRGRTRFYFGSSSDRPLPGPYFDYAADPAIFRGGSGLWAIRGFTRVYFGSAWDSTVPGDYDGSTVWEPGVFRSSSGLWALRGTTRFYFGSSSDLPLPGDYRGEGADRAAVFRSSSGLWAVRGLTRVYYGASGDLPVTR